MPDLELNRSEKKKTHKLLLSLQNPSAPQLLCRSVGVGSLLRGASQVGLESGRAVGPRDGCVFFCFFFLAMILLAWHGLCGVPVLYEWFHPSAVQARNTAVIIIYLMWQQSPSYPPCQFLGMSCKAPLSDRFLL